jgi:hypothetical protein
MRWRRCLLLPPGAHTRRQDTSGSAKAPGSPPARGLSPSSGRRLAYETGLVVWTVVGLVLTPIGAGLATQTRLR